MKKLRNIAILFLSFFSIGCGDSPNSYNKNWGKWSFQSYSPMNGIRATTEMDVDNKTFEVLSNRNFAKDKNHVYYRGNIIEGADGASFELAENDYSIKYGRDKNHLYFNREKIENADPTTFSRVQKSDDDGRIIDPCYWKDKNQVYFLGRPLRNADSETFEIIEYDNKYARDKKNVFFKSYLLSKLNPNTFEILDYPYSKDSNVVYCGNVPMLVKHPETFKVLKAMDSRYDYYYFSVKDLLEDYPEMTHCDTIDTKSFYYSKGAFAEAKGQFFDDFQEVERPESLD